MNSRTPPPPDRVIRPARGLVPIDFAELWRYRELFLFLSWRDILIRYKQTALGIAWAVLQPLLNTFVFVLVFDKLGNFDSKGAPYAVMALAGLIPWQFFANALGESSNSLVASSNMVTKIYFPRLIIPASSVLSGVVDFLVSLMILAVTMLWFGLPFRWSLLGLPLFLFIAFNAAFAAGVWLSALNVNYRDVKYVVPFFTRMGIYLSPVGYLSTLILDKFGHGIHFLYCLNPMVGVIDGFRWCILGDAFQPNWQGLAASGIATMFLLVTGMFYFRSTEKTFADVI